jgi:hypothetical protein
VTPEQIYFKPYWRHFSEFSKGSSNITHCIKSYRFRKFYLDQTPLSIRKLPCFRLSTAIELLPVHLVCQVQIAYDSVKLQIDSLGSPQLALQSHQFLFIFMALAFCLLSLATYSCRILPFL